MKKYIIVILILLGLYIIFQYFQPFYKNVNDYIPVTLQSNFQLNSGTISSDMKEINIKKYSIKKQIYSILNRLEKISDNTAIPLAEGFELAASHKNTLVHFYFLGELVKVRIDEDDVERPAIWFKVANAEDYYTIRKMFN